MGIWWLTHWGRVTHICISKLTIIGWDNGLSSGLRQAITWTNAGILLIKPLGPHFNDMLIEILTFSFMKMRLHVSSAKWRPFCLGLNGKHQVAVVVVIWFDSSKRDTTKPLAVQGYWVHSTITHSSQCSHLELYSSKKNISKTYCYLMKISNTFDAKLLAYHKGLHVTDNKQTPSVYTGGVWTTSRKVSIWTCWSKENSVIDGQWQTITWTNAGLLSIGHLGTSFSEIWIGILSFSFKKTHFKMLSAKMAAILSRARWVDYGGWMWLYGESP